MSPKLWRPVSGHDPAFFSGAVPVVQGLREISPRNTPLRWIRAATEFRKVATDGA
jgi:hypothetical protein